MSTNANSSLKLTWSSSEEDNTSNPGINFAKRYANRRKPLRKRDTTHKDDESDRLVIVDDDSNISDISIPDYILTRRELFKSEGKPRISPNFYGIKELDQVRVEVRPYFTDSHRNQDTPEDVLLKTHDGALGGKIPGAIACWLRGYQVEGVKKMYEKFSEQKGMILGDDMGLGKTVQVCAFLASLYGKTGDMRDKWRMRLMRTHKGSDWYPKTLIICPGTLLSNWRRELQTWGWWVVEEFYGKSKEDALTTAKAGRLEIMLTTYATYMNCEAELNLVEWDCCIADECQIFKSPSSRITKVMNKVNCLCRIGLTGTAIQNCYEDVWSLLHWANPGSVGSLQSWIKNVSKPLRTGQAHNCTSEELALGRTTATNLVRNILPKYFLRRTKKLIADQLPKKNDMIVFCPLSDIQRKVYEKYVSVALEGLGTGDKHDNNSSESREHFFSVCINCIKIANHLAYLIPRNEQDSAQRERQMEILKTCIPVEWESLVNQRPLINYSNPELCGKWPVLSGLLKHFKRNGDKVIIFSYSSRILKMLESLIAMRGDYSYCYLDGAMSYLDRQRQVDKFNTDPGQFIFLVSTKAGGTGLNIVSANRVVIWDPNWNPTHDLQAQDRAYRLGQRRNVEVYRLVSEGTVEEIIYARQVYKQQQANIVYNATAERRFFNGVMGEAEKKGELFGIENILRYNGKSILKSIINKTNVAETISIEAVGTGMSLDLSDVYDFDTNYNSFDRDKSNKVGDNDIDLVTKQKFMEFFNNKEPTSHRDPISAILSEFGVTYAHDNADIIEPTEAEFKLSKDAIDKKRKNPSKVPLKNTPISKYKYNPPKDVQRRHFNSIARTLGYDSPIDFAFAVERTSKSQRIKLLDDFYHEMFPDQSL
ncbi:P-loop containing nucleoside triphosphate hydrolase protein [Dipodascopsis uninucleata]